MTRTRSESGILPFISSDPLKLDPRRPREILSIHRTAAMQQQQQPGHGGMEKKVGPVDGAHETHDVPWQLACREGIPPYNPRLSRAACLCTGLQAHLPLTKKEEIAARSRPTKNERSVLGPGACIP